MKKREMELVQQLEEAQRQILSLGKDALMHASASLCSAPSDHATLPDCAPPAHAPACGASPDSLSDLSRACCPEVVPLLLQTPRVCEEHVYDAAAVLLSDSLYCRSLRHATAADALRAYRFLHRQRWKMFLCTVSWMHLMLGFIEPPSSLWVHGRNYGPSHLGAAGLEALFLAVYIAHTLLQLKAYGGGWNGYWRCPWRRTKVLVLALCVADVLVSIGVDLNEPGVHLSLLLRVFFVLELNTRMRQLCNVILSCAPAIISVLLLLAVHILCFGSIGFIFIGPLERASTLHPENSKMWFSSLGRSFQSMQILLTTANFPSVMLSSYRDHFWVILFFATFIIGGLLGLMQLVLAVLELAFQARSVQRLHRAIHHRERALQAAFTLLSEYERLERGPLLPGQEERAPGISLSSWQKLVADRDLEPTWTPQQSALLFYAVAGTGTTGHGMSRAPSRKNTLLSPLRPYSSHSAHMTPAAQMHASSHLAPPPPSSSTARRSVSPPSHRGSFFGGGGGGAGGAPAVLLDYVQFTQAVRLLQLRCMFVPTYSCGGGGGGGPHEDGSSRASAAASSQPGSPMVGPGVSARISRTPGEVVIELGHCERPSSVGSAGGGRESPKSHHATDVPMLQAALPPSSSSSLPPQPSSSFTHSVHGCDSPHPAPPKDAASTDPSCSPLSPLSACAWLKRLLTRYFTYRLPLPSLLMRLLGRDAAYIQECEEQELEDGGPDDGPGPTPLHPPLSAREKLTTVSLCEAVSDALTLIYALLLVLRMALGFPEPNFSDGHLTNLDACLVALQVQFTVEILAKLWLCGRSFCASRLQVLDALTVLMVWTCDFTVMAQHLGRPHEAVSLMRLVRLLRLYHRLSNFRRLLGILFQVGPSLLALLGVVFCCLYFYAALGMMLFRGRLDRGSVNPKLDYDAGDFYALHYDDLAHALVSVFQQLVVNDFWLPMEAVASRTSDAARIFFISFWAVSVVIIVAACTGFIVNAFVDTRPSRKKRKGAAAAAATTTTTMAATTTATAQHAHAGGEQGPPPHGGDGGTGGGGSAPSLPVPASATTLDVLPPGSLVASVARRPSLHTMGMLRRASALRRPPGASLAAAKAAAQAFRSSHHALHQQRMALTNGATGAKGVPPPPVVVSQMPDGVPLPVPACASVPAPPSLLARLRARAARLGYRVQLHPHARGLRHALLPRVFGGGPTAPPAPLHRENDEDEEGAEEEELELDEEEEELHSAIADGCIQPPRGPLQSPHLDRASFR